MFNILKLFKKPKIGLVLGSGGSKGIAHIAVIEYLQSMEIPIHMISGSSIGAVIGSLYSAGSLQKFKSSLDGMKLREMLSYIDPVFPRSGLLGGNKIMEFLEKYIPRDTCIEDLPVPVGIVATDINSGKPVVFRSGNVLEAVRASISIPGVFEPVKYKDTILVDGGVANPLPIDAVKAMGADLTIAVNLHPAIPASRIKKQITEDGVVAMDTNQMEVLHSIEELDQSAITRGIKDWKWLRSVEKWIGIGKNKKTGVQLPSIFEVFTQAIDVMGYANTTLMLKYNPPDVLIEPDLLDLGTLDFSEAARALAIGHQAADKARKAIMKKIKRRL